jgi:leader peptidase (prepilin peptidase)/N-methyltransferase
MSITLFLQLYGAVIGLLLGSFLNVVIGRIPARLFWSWKQEAREFLAGDGLGHPDEGDSIKSKSKSASKEQDETDKDSEPPGIVRKRSFCPCCGHMIAWYDNLPLISYAILRGKCRHCHTHISWRYPLVELLGALIGFAVVAHWGWTPQAGEMGAFFMTLLACAGIDWDTQIIPDDIVLPATWIALLWSITPWKTLSPEQAILGAVVGYMSLWTITAVFKLITGKVGMGHGDFKLLALIGAALGMAQILPVIFFAAVAGSVAGIGWYLVRKESAPFAFGPYLAVAGVIVALGGGTLWTHMIGG